MSGGKFPEFSSTCKVAKHHERGEFGRLLRIQIGVPSRSSSSKGTPSKSSSSISVGCGTTALACGVDCSNCLCLATKEMRQFNAELELDVPRSGLGRIGAKVSTGTSGAG